jgi:hypothetical protein
MGIVADVKDERHLLIGPIAKAWGVLHGSWWAVCGVQTEIMRVVIIGSVYDGRFCEHVSKYEESRV